MGLTAVQTIDHDRYHEGAGAAGEPHRFKLTKHRGNCIKAFYPLKTLTQVGQLFGLLPSSDTHRFWEIEKLVSRV